MGRSRTPAKSRPPFDRRRLGALLRLAGVAWMTQVGGLRAEEIAVPNPSFESPATAFVSTVISAWQRTPKPPWYDESGGFYWEQLTGLFRNPAPGSAERIENCHGEQAVWLFAVPEVGLFQELQDPEPPHAPDAVYEPTQAYVLTVGILGGGGNMAEGARLDVALSYRDDDGHPRIVAATTITNRAGLFGNPKRFLDYEVRTPVVKPDDPWVGRPLGVRFWSTTPFELQGGYWDLDNVRLNTVPRPVLRDPLLAHGQFTVSVEGELGRTFELLAAADLAAPLSTWERVGIATNLSGRVTFSEPAAAAGQRFYSARQVE